MFMALALVLFLVWILGFSVFHVASAAIHVLVIAAVISIVVHFIRRARTT